MNASAQLLLAVNPNLSSCWICTRSTEKGWTEHPATVVEWTNTKGTLHQSSSHLGSMFFACCLQSDNAETASQALFDLKLQLTPLLEKSQHSTPSKTLPPMTGSIAQADIYGTASLCLQRTHFPDYKPIGSLNTS
jgi:hypothetical protein